MFYAQSTGAVISGRYKNGEKTNNKHSITGGGRGGEGGHTIKKGGLGRSRLAVTHLDLHALKAQ